MKNLKRNILLITGSTLVGAIASYHLVNAVGTWTLSNLLNRHPATAQLVEPWMSASDILTPGERFSLNTRIILNQGKIAQSIDSGGQDYYSFCLERRTNPFGGLMDVVTLLTIQSARTELERHTQVNSQFWEAIAYDAIQSCPNVLQAVADENVRLEAEADALREQQQNAGKDVEK